MYQRILLAFDGSREGRVALTEGIELAALCKAEVHLLSVLEMTGARAMEAGIHPHETDHFQRFLDEGLEQLRRKGIEEPVGHFASGPPAEHIARLAKHIDADLVVVGHRHRGLLARWWQGSTSQQLLDHTDCSILVAFERQRA